MDHKTDAPEFEAVIGIEVHAELKTKTKIFCSCPTDFGAEPNSHCCPVCMGLPGALPVLNVRAVELAALAGMAFDCNIAGFCTHDRKNYFYPDLPKAYQITQQATPLCTDGGIEIETSTGKKRIGIRRIHIEEDAGKLIHSASKGTLIDCNRCGVPLIEIVSKPDIRSSEEARAYLEELRLTLLYADISDCRMNEGSLRCDVNVSLRKKGDTALGTRTEIKNLNSFAFAAKAIDHEIRRQTEILTAGGSIRQQTLRYDEASGKTVVMRDKENAEDYRYFTDYDLPPFSISKERLDELRRTLPTPPQKRREQLKERYGLTDADAQRICQSPKMADYFEAAAILTSYPKTLASLIICDLCAIYRPHAFNPSISEGSIAKLCDLQGSGKINSSTAKALLATLLKCDEDPEELVRRQGLLQIDDEGELLPLVRAAIAENPRAAEDYRRGKTAAARSIVGRVMKSTGGRANPTVLLKLTEQELNS